MSSFFARLKKLFAFFSSHGDEILLALEYAQSKGLTPEVVSLAIRWARFAEEHWKTNVDRRNWVVNALVTRGVPESIARTACELAVQYIQAETAKAEAAKKEGQ